MKKRTFIKSAATLFASASVGRIATVLADDEPAEEHLQDMPDRPWADPASLVTTIAAGTVAVPDVAEAVNAYQQGFAYVKHWHGTIPEETANSWGTPAMAGRAAAIVGPAELRSGLIRFVALGDEFQSIPPRTTLGWRALEIRARNVDAMVDQMAGTPIVHTGGPRDLKFGTGPATLRVIQFKSPSGDAITFTEDLLFDRSKIIGSKNAGGLFLLPLIAVDYVKSRDFYMKTLAMQLRAETSFPQPNPDKSPGAEKDKMIRLSSVRAPEYTAIEIDEVYAGTKARPTIPGYLPPGICMATLFVRDIELVADALRATNRPFTRIDSTLIPPGLGRRALTCRGFSGEFVEFVEA